ncbi:MAG: 2-dehydropantoate 2-reductase [Myxococcota bacterium]
MKIAIVGPGAVGCALGSCLHASGHQIVFVSREETHTEPLGTQDLRRTGILGEVTIPRTEIRTVNSLGQAGPGPFDYVLLCTKTTTNSQIRPQLEAGWADLGPQVWLVICQNGWGNAEFFAERLPRERIANARILTGFRRSDRHTVDVTVHGDPIQVGSLFVPKTRELDSLCAAIQGGGIPCQPSHQIEAELWAKLLYNCLLNPLGALTNVNYGALARNPLTQSIMGSIAREIFAVMDATHSRTFWETSEAYLQAFYSDLLPPTARHESSMLQDIRAERPTEIDVLSGAIVKLGVTHAVDTPINRAMLTLVHAAEKQELTR